MKIVFLTNVITPHQTSMYKAFKNHKDIEFYFIETSDIDKSGLPIGWQSKGEGFSNLVTYEQFRNSYSYYMNLIDNSDVVIIGSAPDSLIEKRLKSDKLTFKYAERFYKKGFKATQYLRNMIAAWIHHGRFQRHPLYMLCASAYTAADCAKFGNYKNRCYKWGYFPELKTYDSINDMIANKKDNSLLWAGRLIDWKHPDTVVRIAKRLKEDGYKFELNIIGTGDMEQQLKKMISDYNLEQEVYMPGSMKPEQVREYMERSQIYLFTSDRNEGWGAVLNEAMNSGCAVVASHAIGSVPFLVNDGENGLIYEDGNEDELYLKVKSLLDNKDSCNKYGRQAYFTVYCEWNAEIAAERFIKLTQSLINDRNNPYMFEKGICSKAGIIKDN